MRIAVLGTGLIGGSIALAATQRLGAEVVAFDVDARAARRAVERGAANRMASDPADAVAGASLVFVATPVRVLGEVVRAAAPGLERGAIVTDVGSTKAKVVVEVETALSSGARFIGGHPMAGSENEGIDAARADLFDGAWWILTPTSTSDADAYRSVHTVVTTLGARVAALAPDEHDAVMALVSHMPQLVATTLMNVAADAIEGPGLTLAAAGFRDVTRIAASNPEIWADICTENRDEIVDALDRFSTELAAVRDLVFRNDRAGVRQRLERGRFARRSLPGKAVAGPAHEVRMPVPDRPGVLAEVTTAIGGLGINIEDLFIVHGTEGDRGVLHLVVLGAQEANAICDALRQRGYSASSSQR